MHLYETPSGPSGFSLAAVMKVVTEPSELCWRTMASKADLVAVTQASSGPYRSLTCRQRLLSLLPSHACSLPQREQLSQPFFKKMRTCSLTRSICALRSSFSRVL